MSQLLHLQDKLQNVGASIGRLEMEVVRHPDSLGLVANMRSLRKLHANLQDEFAHAADELGLDVMHYRLLETRPTAKALSSSVGTFQDAITVAYDALLSGPKRRRSVSPVIMSETSLQVAYSYPGSFGVVFTVPTERMLLPDMMSRFDQAMQTVLDLGKAHDSKATIADAELKFGRATVTAVYQWAKANSQHRMGTAIEWRRSEKVRAEVLIQAPEFTALSEALDNIADRRELMIAPRGTLVGADIKSHRFHFVTDDDDDLRGAFSDAISESQVAEVPHKYSAIIRKTTETKYATDEELVTYFLEKLEPISAASV
ncbi:MAG: hypothetical protein WB952_09965 [Terriglobales bacterium]